MQLCQKNCVFVLKKKENSITKKLTKFSELQVRINLKTLRVVIRTLSRDSNGEQGRNFNTSDRLTKHF